MLELGVSMIIGGVAAFAFTISHAKTEAEANESVQQERALRERFGAWSNGARQFTWAYRATYRHPILMRLPGAVLLAIGVVLILASVS